MRQGSAIRDERRGRRAAVRCSLFAVRRSPFAVRCSPFAIHSPAFTLIELMVVIGIIVVIAAIALPAMGPMMRSNQTAQVVNTLNGLLVTAQAAAEANGTPVAIRIERAFATKNIDIAGRRFEVMDRDINGNAKWLDHQQARFLIFASFKDRAFRQIDGSKVATLPKNMWLAPEYALTPNTPQFTAPDLSEPSLTYAPTVTPTTATVTTYDRLDNFFITFDRLGQLTAFPASDNNYADRTQTYPSTGSPAVPIVPYISHADGSARAVLVYDRGLFSAIPSSDGAARLALLKASRPVFINRTTGSILEEQSK